MNDFSSIENSAGLLKKDYDQSDDALEALRRRQEKLAIKVKAQSQDPKVE